MPERWEYEQDARGRRISIWSTGQFVYITDLFHTLVRDAYDRRCRELGLSPYQSLPAAERVRLDLELLDKYGDDRMPMDVRHRLREWLYAAAMAERAKK